MAYAGPRGTPGCMNRDTNHLRLATNRSPTALQPVLRDVVVIAVLVLVLGLASVLPGAGRPLFETGITVGDAATALVAAGIVGVVLHVAPAVGDLVRAHVRGRTDVVEDLARAAQYLVVFLAVLVAHRGLAPVVLPLLRPDATWAYDVVFLGFALFAVVAVGYRLARNADEVAHWLTDELSGSSAVPSGGQSRTAGDAVDRDG